LNFFEQELRKLIDAGVDLDNVKFAGRACYGDLGGRNRAKLQYVTTGTADNYTALAVDILNRTDGRVDSLMFRFKDIWGRKLTDSPDFSGGISPHIWTSGNKSEWAVYKPMPRDFEQLAKAVNGYLSVFAERSAEQEYALENSIAADIAAKTAVFAETINGAVTYGDWVIVRPDEAYGCLVGQVTAIDKVGSEEHGTDNPGDDVHVNFVALEYTETAKAELLEAFDGYFPDAGNFDALPLDDVIMAPESLISLTGLDFDEIDKLSASYKAAREFGNRALTETYDGLEQQLIARVEQNYTDYNRTLLSFGQRELIDMAGKIAAMQDAYEYITTSRGYSDNELRFYMQYACPLEIVADALIAYDVDEGDIGFAMDYVIEHQESISPEYTKIVDAQPAAEPVKQPDRPKLPRAADAEPKPHSLTSQLDAATAEANERNAARTPQTQQKSKNKEID
jgi:hypothetical protein